MSKYLDMARRLRQDPEVHYSCSQATLMPFAEDAGLDVETARKLASNFNAGMRRGSVCGAITGGLMVLGLFGVNDTAAVHDYHKKFSDRHEGRLDCAELLRASAQRGEIKKEHCDGMVYEAVMLVEEMLKERELIW